MSVVGEFEIGSSILMAILNILGEPNLVGGGDKILWPHINSNCIGPKVAVGVLFIII
jgi:hypothetical protein